MTKYANGVTQLEGRLPLHALFRFGRGTRRTLASLGFLLLLIPKMNVVSLQTDAAGLRIDDILLFLCLTFFTAAFFYISEFTFTMFELIFLGWAGEMLLSNALNVEMYGRSSFFYSIRFIEYFLFFYFGYYFAERHQLTTLAKTVLWLNGPVMVLQELGLTGGFASAGHVSSTGDRAIGLTGGPWEVGVLINFCLAILIFSRKVTTGYAVRVFLLTTALLLMTASRMAMLANAFILIAFFRHNGYRMISLLWKTAVAVGILAAGIVLIPNPLQARSQNLFSVDNLTSLEEVYGRIPENPDLNSLSLASDYTGSSDTNSDASWLMRVVKWSISAKMWSHSDATILLGVGPGTFGPALDGGWLRILTETGVLGLIGVLFVARSLWRRSLTIRIMLLAMAINMLMIDIYLSYKVMTFLLFVAGYTARATILRLKNRSNKGAPSVPPIRGAEFHGVPDVGLLPN